MNKFLKHVSVLTLAVTIGVSLAGCGGQQSADGGQNKVVVNFWAAPQKVQYNYWVKKAAEFNATNTKTNGKIIEMKVQEMPETPSSEAGIQNAIATDNVPAISENINRGFAATLAKSDAVYPLEQEQWFKDVISSRDMGKSIEGWKISNHQYVLPLYVNPMMYEWNMVALRALGFKAPPKTIDDLKAVIEKFRENKGTTMKQLGVDTGFYRPTLLRPDQWFDRWFDFQMQYEALSGGKSWVNGDTLALDKTTTNEVFQLLGMFGNTLQTATLSNIWQTAKPSILVTINAPWDIQSMRAANKKYGLNGDYIYGQPIVKKASDTPYSFGDSKGLVLYKHKNITDDQHQGAVDFVKWLYNSKNSTKTDLDWLQATTMLPVRGDLTTNQYFKTYFDKNSELKDLAKYVPYTIPCMANANMTEIQTALTQAGIEPYTQITSNLNTTSAPDATKYVNAAFEAMKEKGGLK